MFTLNEYFYGKSKLYLCAPLHPKSFKHPVYQWAQAIDLRAPVEAIQDLSYEDLKKEMKKSEGKNVSKIIKEFLKIKCPINKAANELNNFFKKNKINLVVDQKYFPISNNKISKLNVVFSASFGRQLEYYTGMVFKIDIKSKSKNRNIINGGRYDKLISDLGAKNQVAAVGAALNLNY